MDKFYYIDKNRQQTGPVSPTEFKRFGICNETLVWKPGMPNWTPAGHIPQLTPFLEVEKDGRKILWRIAAICGGVFVLLISLFLVAIFASRCANDDAIVEENVEPEIMVVAEDEGADNIAFKKQLAESAIIKAQKDYTLAKEAIHLRRKKNIYSSFKPTGDEEYDSYLRQEEREAWYRDETRLDQLHKNMLEKYDEEDYQGVLDRANQIESVRIKYE